MKIQGKECVEFVPDIEHPVPPAGLSHVFKNDQLSKKVEIGQTKALDAPSLLNKLKSWFYSVGQDSEIVTPLETKTHEPISLIPELASPNGYSKDLQKTNLPHVSIKKDPRASFNQSDITETIASLKDKTIDEIVAIVMQEQMELEKENALVAENTLSTYQKYKKLHENTLPKIKEALSKDEKVLAHCKTAQNVAVVASCICGALAATVTFGVFAPVGILATIAAYGPVAAAALVGIGSGARAYSERRLDEDKADFMKFNHQDKLTLERMEEAKEHLQRISESDQAFKETFLKQIKSLNKMTRLVLQQ